MSEVLLRNAFLHYINFSIIFLYLEMDSDKGGCCPPGSEPFLAATYKPKGEVIKLDDLECYVYGKGDKAVICSYDIYGFDAGRTRLMVDQIADAGYLAILPDYYRGVKWGADDPIGPDTFKWILDFTWEKVWKDITDKVLPYLAEKGATKIGLTGTCWGAWVVLKACTTDKFACGVSWHPSFQCEKIFGGNEEEVAEKVKAPQIIMPAGGD